MIVQHSLQLLRYHRRLVIGIVLVSTLATCGLSVARLLIAPVYTATAMVVVLPTEAEYTFGREASGGGQNAARGLTATYMEYLRSRPVVESALAKVRAASAGSGGEPKPESALARRVKGMIGFARRIYRTLDSGSYVPSTEEERELSRLSKAIDLEKVADSYILKILVNLDDATASKVAANALAEAYVERVSQQLATSAGQIGGFLEEEIRKREQALQALLDQAEQLKASGGITSLTEERQRLLAERDTARQKLVDAQQEVNAAEAELLALERVDSLKSGRNPAELSQQKSAAEARLDAAKRTIATRQGSLNAVDRSLEKLGDKEEPLLELTRKIDGTKAELADLQGRALSTHLTGSSANAQVKVIEPAVLPVYHSSPRVVRNTAAGLFAGVLLALFAVFVIDTVSGKVKTAADLERIVGSRCLEVLPAALVARTTAPEGRTLETRESLKSVGSGIERGLAVLGAFESSVIQVTGFVDSALLGDVAVTIGTAIASQGRRVLCTLTDRLASVDVTRKIVGDARRPAAARADGERTAAPAEDATEVDIRLWARSDSDRQIRVKCLQPVSADLMLKDAATRSSVLVCVLPTGRVAESDVHDLMQRAMEAGFRSVGFVLLAP